MRFVIAFAMLAAGLGPGQADEQSVTKDLTACVGDLAASGGFSSSDGGKSAMAALQACPFQTGAFLRDCDSRGVEKQRCNMMALIDAQAAMKLKGY